ncbi:unnamed protein product [Lampetra planeri]
MQRTGWSGVAALLACLVALVGALAVSRPDPALDGHWEAWTAYFKKAYTQTDGIKRRLIWEENMRFVDRHNLEHSMGLHSYTLGMNHLADLTVDEFRKTMNGYRRGSRERHEGHHTSTFLAPENYEVPQSMDWRDQGLVTPIKNQGLCGSCWAFSSTGALEGQWKRRSGELVPLSEQNLLDCSRPEGTEGCGGGWMDDAFQYVLDQGGIDSESDYPYTATDVDSCHYDPSRMVAQMSGFVDVRKGSEKDLITAVASVGPVSVAIDAGHQSFQLYESGIYYEPECNSTELDHAVLVVGFGVKGRGENGKKFWIVKNSWSTSWGDEGYILMARDRKNNCGIASAASYPLV